MFDDMSSTCYCADDLDRIIIKTNVYLCLPELLYDYRNRLHYSILNYILSIIYRSGNYIPLINFYFLMKYLYLLIDSEISTCSNCKACKSAVMHCPFIGVFPFYRHAKIYRLFFSGGSLYLRVTLPAKQQGAGHLAQLSLGR